MSVVEPGSDSGKLVARVKGMLMKPAETWDEIDVEPASISGLYTGYAVPLAGVAALAGLANTLLFGSGRIWAIAFHVSTASAIAQALSNFLMSLLSLAILAVVADSLAPKFEGTSDRIQAFKLAVYAATAGWVGSMLVLVPVVGWPLAFAGAIYSLYALYRGLPKLMKSAPDRTTPYFAVILIVCIVLGLIIGGVTGKVTSLVGGPLHAVHEDASITLPGDATIDLGKLEDQANRAEAAMKQIQSGDGGASADPEALKAYLPGAVAGFTRTKISAGTSEMAGMEGAGAEGAYEKGAATIELTVADIGAAGAIAGLAGSFNLRSSEEEGDSYKKIGKVDGRMAQESYDRSAKKGEYSVLVADKFIVSAKGDGASVDELKAAVKAVDFAALEKAARAD